MRPFLPALLLLSALPGLSEGAPKPKPNVVLFLVDDMGWVDCGAYGSRYYETPRIDRFSQEAMRFTQAYSQPLCSPTRASLLTGQHSARHRITSATGHTPPQAPGTSLYPEKVPPTSPLILPESQNYLEPSQYTLAEALRDAGYRTGHFGKWHLGLTQPHWPEQQGFQVAFHAEPSAGPPGAYFSPYGVTPPGQPKTETRRATLGTITDGPPGEYITDRLTDEALKFIAADPTTPFYLNLWHYGVHGPWGHKESYTAAFAGKTDPLGRQDNPVMASMLKSIDESLGRLLDKLDELGIAENTIVLFTSDNGGNTSSMTEEDSKASRKNDLDPLTASYRKWAGHKPPTNNAPLRAGKGKLYEGGVRVPLMVRWPGVIAPGTTNDTVVGCIDAYPTLLELCGLVPKATQKIDGLSYAPVLRGTGSIQRNAYFIWFPHLIPGVSVRQGDWKLIRRFTARPADYEGLHELFHLGEDPGETTNLASKMPDKVKELDALIDGFVADTGALYPKPNPHAKRADPAAGLVARSCQITVGSGVLRIDTDGNDPFLGLAGLRTLRGPLSLSMRIRSSVGGTGKIQWKTALQPDFPASGQTVDFPIPAGADWQQVNLTIPLEGEPGVVRLHLPPGPAPVEIERLDWSGANGTHKTWNFAAP
jgi:arylsulfatase A-like enzyme